MALLSWKDQIARDQAFLIRAVPFALTFLLVVVELRFRLDAPWPIVFAAGLGCGLLAAVLAVRSWAAGFISFFMILRLILLVLRDRFS